METSFDCDSYQHAPLLTRQIATRMKLFLSKLQPWHGSSIAGWNPFALGNLVETLCVLSDNSDWKAGSLALVLIICCKKK